MEQKGKCTGNLEMWKWYLVAFENVDKCFMNFLGGNLRRALRGIFVLEKGVRVRK